MRSHEGIARSGNSCHHHRQRSGADHARASGAFGAMLAAVGDKNAGRTVGKQALGCVHRGGVIGFADQAGFFQIDVERGARVMQQGQQTLGFSGACGGDAQVGAGEQRRVQLSDCRPAPPCQTKAFAPNQAAHRPRGAISCHPQLPANAHPQSPRSGHSRPRPPYRCQSEDPLIGKADPSPCPYAGKPRPTHRLRHPVPPQTAGQGSARTAPASSRYSSQRPPAAG
jgi:hypothetical protein